MTDLLARIDGLDEPLYTLILDFAGPLSLYLLRRGEWRGNFSHRDDDIEAVYADAYAMNWQGDLATLPEGGPRRWRDRTSRSFESISTPEMYERYRALTYCRATCPFGFRNAYDDDTPARDDDDDNDDTGVLTIPPDTLDEVGLRNLWYDAVVLFLDRPIALAHAAAYGGHANLLFTLEQDYGVDLARLRSTPDGKKYLLDYAAGRGYLDVVMFLTRAGNPYCTTDAMDDAIANGHVKTVRWLHYARNEGCSTKGLDKAYYHRRTSHAHTAILDFLVQECGLVGFSEESFAIAAAYGDMRFLRACHANGVVCTTKTMDAAARSGKLEVLEFLHAYRKECCSDAAFTRAAAQGELSTVQFLHTHYPNVGNLVNAMTAAARRGRLEVVEWLHTLVPIGTAGSKPMDAAVRHGHLKVVQFLQSHRPSEGLSLRAFEAALCMMHEDLYLFLMGTRPDFATPATLDCVARHGRDELIWDLYARGVRSPNTMAWAACWGRIEWMRKLHDVYDEAYTDAATDRAASRGHTDVVDFLLEEAGVDFTYQGIYLAAYYDEAAALAHLAALDTSKRRARAILAAAGLDGDVWYIRDKYTSLIDPAREDLLVEREDDASDTDADD
ncbi:hypothetical protein SPRG_01537 [Saprolegnia parasitica CBS 223.65]|uniref:Uncharacterized protein n=1 Tax=Saprolegnia parasitica (strain CBS 223.65) TaxID=695850 RepID=A0A067D6S7_SAPPC|nr:hypothetical protein SPRG_01537 [Saprolegnia parasitica CBS 223.65]KDO34401.1 hypothetical protein SPRG_01537 [Saprolegnia parasitica CBS 223.65]|eukprot:XP_012195136.1 hypothetical protein SPRG_01537 [Saprolegnia parasitica CBS 223.65]